MAKPRTKVDIAGDPRRWDWVLPPALRMSRDAAIGWYEQFCADIRKSSDLVEAAYFGANEGSHPDAQRQMAEAFDTHAPPPGEPTVIALAMTAAADQTLQWVRMFWAVYGAEVTLRAVRASLFVQWTSEGQRAWTVTAPRQPLNDETDFLRGLVNTLPAPEQRKLRETFGSDFEAASGTELNYWMHVFPGPSWAERGDLGDAQAVRLASMVESHHEAGRLLREVSSVDPADVELLVVNLLSNHGHGKTMRILTGLLDTHPELLEPVLRTLDEVVASVAACEIAARDIEVGREYLLRFPQHAAVALAGLSELDDRQAALLAELEELPGARKTSETVSYWPLGWEVVDDGLLAGGPGSFGEWDDVEIEVRVHRSLAAQVDENDPIGALDLLQPEQRDTLQFVVDQWTTIALVAGTLLKDNGATPVKVVIRTDDEPLVYGIAATSKTDIEHGLGIAMKALAVSGVGPMSLIL